MTVRSVDPSPETKDLHHSWRERGFVIVRGVFEEAEINRAADEADRLLARTDLIHKDNLRCRWQTNEATGECQFETFDPVIDIAPACRSLANDPRILGVLHQLYGEPACLFKDKLILKRPGMKGYNLHQDWIAWERFPHSFLTVLIPFDRASVDNGCTEVFPGYHKLGPLSPEDGYYHELSFGLIDESTGVPLELEVGDVAIFDGFTPHRSLPNRSGSWRRQLYLSYNAFSDGGELREQHYVDFHNWLRSRYSEHNRPNTFFI
jgi:ectoine hydroxylase-related dioxygenase (phytanoyl-CoA dioxygenase family)